MNQINVKLKFVGKEKRNVFQKMKENAEKDHKYEVTDAAITTNKDDQ